MNPVAQGKFDEISHLAFECYILALLRGYAAEEERVHRENRGKELNPLIKEIKLTGEFPETIIRIQRFDRVRGIEYWQMYPLWGDPTFFDDNKKLLGSPERMVGDILMYARGG